MTKKVLVTGGAGFIGTAVAKNLAAIGLEVKLFDLDFDMNRYLLPENRILADARKIQGSILDANAICNAIRGCDYVIHLAAMLGVRRTELLRTECLNINILGTVNVLEACIKEKVKKIIFSSSSEVYGETDGRPISEESPKNPISIYAITKLAGEEYVKAYSQRYGLSYSIVRFFNIYGPGQVAEFVVPRFIKRAIENKPPVVYGDGSQVRTFCFVDDAAEGVKKALIEPAADFQTFNIGNDTQPISMKDLAYKVIKISDKELKPQFVSMNDSDRHSSREIKNRIPSINKVSSVLNYKPKISLDEGIRYLLDTKDIVDAWCEE